MSIRPATIDRRGEQPCLPANALLAVCERIAQGHVPTLRDRIVAALNHQPPDNAIAAMVVLTAIAIGLVLITETLTKLFK